MLASDQNFLSTIKNKNSRSTRNWLMFFFLTFFIGNLILQYLGILYYLQTENNSYQTTTLLRALAVTLFWLGGYALTFWAYHKTKKGWRYLPIALWTIFYIFSLSIWVANIGVLYYSGLYFGPMATAHAEGSAGILINKVSLISFLFFLILSTVLVVNLKQITKKINQLENRFHWQFPTIAIALITIFFTLLPIFRSTPEYIIASSFYQYWTDQENTYGQYDIAPNDLNKNDSSYTSTTVPIKMDADTIIFNKLKRFGLEYDPNAEIATYHANIFDPTSAPMLVDHFNNQKPNILIFFLESFSADLTSVYNPKFVNLTPGLEKIAADKNTTIFKNYYNASTPTSLATIAQLCSFLLPSRPKGSLIKTTNDKNLDRLPLLCLPEILKKQGYKETSFFTGIDKNFANQYNLLTSIGIDKYYGQTELSRMTVEKPLAWGYSDHQILPIVEKKMASTSEPFMISASTLDSHPPFQQYRDAIPYQNGENNVLNSFHTTDDALSLFWDNFKNSRFYNNTIVIFTADHAAFPGEEIRNLFPEKNMANFYDPIVSLIYVPNSTLPKIVDQYASSVDLTPTLLQILNINTPNTFEGHSLFSDREKYPNILGMDGFGLYINQQTTSTNRKIEYYQYPDIQCTKEDLEQSANDPQLTLCEYKKFYEWKKEKFESGKFWKKQ